MSLTNVRVGSLSGQCYILCFNPGIKSYSLSYMEKVLIESALVQSPKFRGLPRKISMIMHSHENIELLRGRKLEQIGIFFSSEENAVAILK